MFVIPLVLHSAFKMPVMVYRHFNMREPAVLVSPKRSCGKMIFMAVKGFILISYKLPVVGVTEVVPVII
jgi:hypothetical protein